MMTEEEQMRMELQRMQRRADEITDEVIFSDLYDFNFENDSITFHKWQVLSLVTPVWYCSWLSV